MTDKNIYTELDVNTLKQLLYKLDDGDKSQQKAIIIKFGATWCNPCKQIKELCTSLYNDLPNNILYFDIDIDDNVELYVALKAKKMINGIPTLLAYGKRSDRNYQHWYADRKSVV